MAKLTEAQIKNAAPREKRYTLRDENGLFLEVPPKGNKRWRLRYFFDGVEKLVSLGTYPLVSLKDARTKRDQLRGQIRDRDNPQDPSALRKQAREARKKALEVEAQAEAVDGQTFEKTAREWHKKRATAGHAAKGALWSPAHAARIMRGLESNVFPWIGSTPISTITPRILLEVIQRIEARGTIETAHRDLSVCGQVFRFGVACGYCERDVAADLRGALTPVVHKHHAAVLEPQAIGELLRHIEAYQGGHVVKCALRLAPYVFVRPGELRHAEWSEINFSAAEWRIPPEKMKARRMHIVPLAKQALEILQNDLRPLTGSGPYLFPGRVSARPMSENTLNAALRALGYSGDQMTGHGFRSIASTHLNEAGFHRDAVERQLAHAESNEVRAAYLHADFLAERRKMMQWWADALDSLRDGADSFPRREDENNG
ncbi:MAG TPA: integrase [Desulfomicrobium sp.]|nr:integrase [Desulfomicrobium sp.]